MGSGIETIEGSDLGEQPQRKRPSRKKRRLKKKGSA